MISWSDAFEQAREHGVGMLENMLVQVGAGQFAHSHRREGSMWHRYRAVERCLSGKFWRFSSEDHWEREGQGTEAMVTITVSKNSCRSSVGWNDDELGAKIFKE